MRSAISLARGAARGRPAITATGVSVPAGSLDQWFTARDASASRLAEVAIYGDSTWAGQATGASYSPADRLRERLIAAGYTDGGHGNLNGIRDTLSAGESLTRAQWTATGGTAVLPGESDAGVGAGDVETFTRVGRYLTLWFSRFNSGGRFTYEIDSSGVEVVVDPVFPDAGRIYHFVHTPVIDMGSVGTHTIVVRNKGGRLVLAPDYTSGSTTATGTGGTLPSGSYDYAVAFAAPDGKVGSLTTTATIAVTLGQNVNVTLFPQASHNGTTTNYYRRAAGVGNYKLIGSAATGAGSPYVFTDTGAAGGTDYTLGAAPVLNSALKWVCAATVVTKGTGIVLHNLAARATTSRMAATPDNLALGLGLDLDAASATAANARTVDSSPGALHPVLTLLTHGINDQQETAVDNSAAYAANVVTGIRAVRRAGSDVLVVLPCWETANQQQNASLYRAAGKAAAEGEGAPWIDIGIGGALPSVVAGATTDPHLTVAQYQAQGDFIWDQVLGR